MDIRNGNILTANQIEAILKALPANERFLRPMALEPTPLQLSRRPPRVGRNEPCPCGSGRKFKRCCYQGPPPVQGRRGGA